METKLEWLNVTIAEARSNLADYTRQLESHKNQLIEVKEQRIREAKYKDILHKICSNSSTIPMLAELEANHVENVQHYLRISYRRASEKYDTLSRDESYYTSQIGVLTGFIAELNEQLSSPYEEKYSITLDEVQDQLRPFPKVIPGSIELFYNRNPFIKWQFDRLYYTPSYLQQFILDIVDFKDLPPKIPIAKTEVSINLVTQSIKIISVDDHPLSEPYIFADHCTPHPHVLDDDSPCLGDFRSSFEEAINTCDWATMVLVVQSFLEHVNNSDSAGSGWKRFFTNFLMEGETATQDELGFYRIKHCDGTISVHPICKHLAG